MKHEKVYPAPEVITVQMDDGIIPKPFHVNEYLSHFKRHHKTRFSRQTLQTVINIYPQTLQTVMNRYLLFILDGSGSIGLENFTKMKKAVGELAYIFQHCGFTAIMTYDTCAYLEYDFDCYKTNVSTDTLASMHEKINDIQYPDGWTATGYAIKMAYDEIISKISKSASEIDVIIITDGHSNRGTNPCTEANEIWEKEELSGKINVFPIGIGNVNHTELHCIMGESPSVNQPLHVLNFTTLNNIINKTIYEIAHNLNRFCARFDNFQEIICEYSPNFIIADKKN